jgi:hypothetical protein
MGLQLLGHRGPIACARSGNRAASHGIGGELAASFRIVAPAAGRRGLDIKGQPLGTARRIG